MWGTQLPEVGKGSDLASGGTELEVARTMPRPGARWTEDPPAFSAPWSPEMEELAGWGCRELLLAAVVWRAGSLKSAWLVFAGVRL